MQESATYYHAPRFFHCTLYATILPSGSEAEIVYRIVSMIQQVSGVDDFEDRMFGDHRHFGNALPAASPRQCASFQFFPIPASTFSGTDS